MSNLTEKPTPPAPAECCEGNCDPCVWDHYYAALSIWNKQQKALKAEAKKENKQANSSS